MSTRQLSISDFAAHCLDEIQSLQDGKTIVEIVSRGQVVAYLSPAPKPVGNSGTLADWMGTGAGYVLPPGSSLDEPSFTPEEWEEHPASDN